MDGASWESIFQAQLRQTKKYKDFVSCHCINHCKYAMLSQRCLDGD
jgi:hypothetical protein